MTRRANTYSQRLIAGRRSGARALLAASLLLCGSTWIAGSLRADETTRQIQEELRKRNLFFGDVDGHRTSQFIAALRRYQDRKGFDASGEADDQTLRSLMLPVPASAFSPPAAGIAISNPNPTLAPNATPSAGAGAASAQDVTVPYWPDITVLRSDQGRRNVPTGPMLASALSGFVPGVGDPLSPPARMTIVPPPTPSSLHPTAADARDFIVRYLRAGQTNAPEAELAFYGDQVVYFDDGTVDRRYIAQDIQRYEKRWPQRTFTLVGAISAVADANNLDHTLVHFRYQFTNKNARYTVNGETDNLFTLSGSGPDSLRIIAMRERRVR